MIGDVAARLYRSSNSDDNVLIWLHGGGWAFGDLDSADMVARALANRSKSQVLTVDYRLTPENPFPAGLEDCWAATVWASARFVKVAVGGDSSGGNLAAATALRAREERLPLALQLLVYPVLSHDVNWQAYRDFALRYDGFAGIDRYGTNFGRAMSALWDIELVWGAKNAFGTRGRR